LRLLPAPPGSGIVFRRSDLDGFEVEATGRNVARVSYATSLMKKGVLISTTEHLLAALMGMGIDNAIVELDNLELPILDGSAQPFVDMVLRAGTRKQRRRRTYMRILRAVELREGNKFIAIYQLPASSHWSGNLHGGAHFRGVSPRDRSGTHLRFSPGGTRDA
jgi:UDP-3-O-[3-hydroxymyristoyl] N-acetylglucosamine deacetylase